MHSSQAYEKVRPFARSEEAGTFSASHHQKNFIGPFTLENGTRVQQLEIAYTSAKTPSSRGVTVVLHGITASSDFTAWWPGAIGKGAVLDPFRESLLGINLLGSCYGTSGPDSTEHPLFSGITPRDMVETCRLLLRDLGIRGPIRLVGPSLGGQVALEWAVTYPNEVGELVLLATNAVHSAWGRAFNETQRMALETDPLWGQPVPDNYAWPGLQTARAVAMLSYRTYTNYRLTELGDGVERTAQSYQRHQGLKLVQRFNPYAYHALTRAMCAHDVGRNRGGASRILKRITAKTTVVSYSSDALFPPEEQEFLAQHIPDANYVAIQTAFGHDGFLVETEKLNKLLKR